MRVFTLALVASSTLLPRPDGVSEAASPALVEHQDPAVAVMATDDKYSPPSRVLRSEETMGIPERLESLGLQIMKSMGMAERTDQPVLPRLVDALLHRPEVHGWLRRSQRGEQVIESFIAHDADGVVKQLFVMREQETDWTAKEVAKRLCAELVKGWPRVGKTPSQVFELLDLRRLSFDELFVEQSSAAVSDMRNFCKAAEPGRDEIVFLETAIEGFGGDDAFASRLSQLTTDELRKVEEHIIPAVKQMKSNTPMLPQDMTFLKILFYVFHEATTSSSTAFKVKVNSV